MTSKWAWITTVVCLIAVILAISASGLLKPLGHDENMYCAAGALMAQGKLIYHDFSYVAHLPYHPLLLSAVYKLLDTDHYLLVGRLISIFCDCLVVIMIFAIYIRQFGNSLKKGIYLGLAAAALCAFNPFVNYAGGFAWNHSVVLLCAVVSFWLCAARDTQRPLQYWRIAAIAVLLTFATFSRITTALFWLIFFIFVLFDHGSKLKACCTFLIASVAVSLWPLYIIAQAPEAFYLDVLVNPVLNGRYLHQIGMAYSKLQMLWSVITEPVYALTVLAGIFLWLIGFVNYRNIGKVHCRNMMLAVSLTVASLIIALVPLTVWEQYFAMPIVFLLISLAYPLAHLTGGKYLKLVNLAACAIVVATIVLNPLPLAAISSAFTVSNWVPIQVHSIADDIAAKVGKGNRILTLAPLFAIEGGCQIYPELAAGPFAYRVADFMTAKDRAIAKVAGPAEIPQMARQTPPSGIFLGTEPPPLEEPLRKVAQPDWKTQAYLQGQLRLLFP